MDIILAIVLVFFSFLLISVGLLYLFHKPLRDKPIFSIDRWFLSKLKLDAFAFDNMIKEWKNPKRIFIAISMMVAGIVWLTMVVLAILSKGIVR